MAVSAMLAGTPCGSLQGFCRAPQGAARSLPEARSEAVQPFVNALQRDGAVAEHQSRSGLAHSEVGYGKQGDACGLGALQRADRVLGCAGLVDRAHVQARRGWDWCQQAREIALEYVPDA